MDAGDAADAGTSGLPSGAWMPGPSPVPEAEEPAEMAPEHSEPSLAEPRSESAPQHASPAPEEVPPWRRGVAFRPTPLPPPDGPSSVAPPAAEETTPSWRATAPAPAPPPAELAAPAGPAVQPGPAADPFGPAGILVLPETIAGWLMSGGALVGVLALFLPWRETSNYTAAWGLASGMNILVGIALLAVLVVLLAPHWVPAIPRRDLVVAAIGLLGVGIGLDRLGLPLTGMGATVFLIAMILVAGGGLIAELGLDRRTGGMRS